MSPVRITWRSVDWLDDDYRARVEARLQAFEQEGGGANRVEIASQATSESEDACTEVRISGVIRKCQLTAVREHHAPERALEDALDAFARNVGYVLETRGREPIVMPATPAGAGVGASVVAISSDLLPALGARMRAPLHAIADGLGALEELPAQLRRLPALAASGLASALRRPESDGLEFLKRPSRSRGRLTRIATAASIGVVLGTGAWWFVGGAPQSAAPTLTASAAPAPVSEAIAFSAVAGDPEAAFSAVAQRTLQASR